jgi:L-malate glycosyltransferase
VNILELCLSSGLGGLELYVFRCSVALQQKHTVITVVQPNSKLDMHYRDNSTIERRYITRKRSPVPIVNARELASIIDQHDIDLVHMHWGKDLALASLGKRLSRKKPKLVYTRQMMITRYKNDIYHRFLYQQVDLMLTITKQLETLCKKFIASDHMVVRTLYYGVRSPDKLLSKDDITALRDDKRFSDEDFLVGLFGRLEDGKGQHLLIKAVAIAKQNGLNIKALIVGHEMDQGYREQLRLMAQNNGVADRIQFNDFVTHPQELMQICDCICLTTYEETFGLVLPEAMRAGVAVIGSDAGGVPEIIDHQKTGLLFRSKDEKSLYQQLAFYYQNPQERERIARQGKQKADDMFDETRHFSMLDNILTECVNG